MDNSTSSVCVTDSATKEAANLIPPMPNNKTSFGKWLYGAFTAVAVIYLTGFIFTKGAVSAGGTAKAF